MGDEEFETADAGVSEGTPIACGAIKKGNYVIMKGKPCKIVDVSASKTGKHGSAKINYVGIDIFSNKRMEECRPSGHTVYAPTVTRTECPLLSIDDGYLTLMTQSNDTRSDIAGGDMLDSLQEKYDNLKDDEELWVCCPFYTNLHTFSRLLLSRLWDKIRLPNAALLPTNKQLSVDFLRNLVF